MRKLFTLLLLGGLLFVGAGNVWADFELWQNDRTAQSPTAGSKVADFSAENGVFMATLNIASAGDYYFWVKNTANSYGYVSNVATTSFSGTEKVTVYEYTDISYGYANSIKLSVDNNHLGEYYFIFDSSNPFYFGCGYNKTHHKVTVYINDNLSGASVNMFLYSWDENYRKYSGAWAGYESDVAGITMDSKTWYKHELSVPDGQSLNIIISGTLGGNWHSTATIPVGTISSDKNLYYQINGYSDGNWTYNSNPFPWSLRGTFNGWSGDLNQIIDFATTVDLSAGNEYSFKITNGSTWYGSSTPVSDGTAIDLSSSGDDISFTPTIDGTYTFSVGFDNNVPKSVTVTYPSVHERKNLAAGAWGTICLPGKSKVSYYPNATFYSIAGKRVDGNGDPTSVVLVEENGDLVAGRPYIFKMKTAGDFALSYNGSASASSHNGLIGTLVQMENNSSSHVLEGYYVLVGSEVRKVGVNATVTLPANRAYFNLGEGGATVFSSPAPGRRYLDIPLAPNTTTSIENIEETEKAVKFFENGQLFIQRNGVVYDATGRAVK